MAVGTALVGLAGAIELGFTGSLIAGLIAGGTESAYNISSYLINRLIAAF